MSKERGSITVIVALLMVAMLGFVAIAVDVGKIYSERRSRCCHRTKVRTRCQRCIVFNDVHPRSQPRQPKRPGRLQ
jgi:hypothetical protein